MIARSFSGSALGALALALCLSTPAAAQSGSSPVSVRNSFRIGSSGVSCTAQNAPLDPRLKGMFDRAYRLSCRDAAGSIGSLIAVRRAVVLGVEPSSTAGLDLACGTADKTTLDGLGAVDALTCRDAKSNVDYRRYAVERGGVSYLVEGLAGYDPALRLALATVVNDRAQNGEIRVATTEVSDPAAFARVQAGLLEASDARDEAYNRNNGGRFAESAEFFETIATRDRGNQGGRLAEALANGGLQQSNLANFKGADDLFAEANRQIARGDGVTQRLLRNYRAINALNQRQSLRALEVLSEPVAAVSENFAEDALRQGIIESPLADQINRENVALQRLGGIDPGLSMAERAQILDAQAQMLSGIANRQRGRLDDATPLLNDALRVIDEVRDGRVLSTGFLRSEIQIELALIAEAQGRGSDSLASFDKAIAAIGVAYPSSPALLAAQARKAAYLGRSGDAAGARALYAQVVEAAPTIPDSGSTLRTMLSPYFALLASNGGADAAKDLFAASQVLQRPGVAQTQAILARELSEGNDEASSLFRLSVARTREVARLEGDVGRMAANEKPTPQDIENLRVGRETLDALKQDQVALTSKLSAFPRYNVLAPQSLAIGDLQSALRPGEGYYKLMVVANDIYALFVTPDSSRVVPIPGKLGDLEADVQILRDSIVKVENGEQVNYPFDVVRARQLYTKLFGGIDGEMQGLKHLIFEPDGPMLQLPPYLLVTADRGVTAYETRMKRADADAFDFTGVDWLGRGREVSIAVSPRGFLDIRALKPSTAAKNYLGLGHNAVPRSRPIGAVATECDWPIETWQSPIAPDELFFAQGKLSRGGGDVRTDGQFTDSALLADKTLDDYRVLHFATHGLVTAPRPGCPARPALVTSFGDSGSDGLLTFREIFDLKLNADLVILSACDTAGMATIGASRDAGVTTGGNFALDGLVRAFVGAGARSVVASHWPVPDTYDATKRLIGGLLDAAPGVPIAMALEQAQEKLMDDPQTSHPFYWSAFIILGDGAKPLVPATATAAAGMEPPAAR